MPAWWPTASPCAGLPQLRHQRPHPDRDRALARRRRGEVPGALRLRRDHRPQPVRDDRRAGGGGAGGGGDQAGPRGQAGAEDRGVRRARGDPDSVAFFDRLGLDYVSCSPYRVPIARVAAAQSAAAPEPNPDPTARFEGMATEATATFEDRVRSWRTSTCGIRRPAPTRRCATSRARQPGADALPARPRRIVHSKAFRRLKHKTQVFVAPEGDHYRTA